MGPLRTVILAAGKGKRMSSERAKVLHLLCGKPLLSYVIQTAQEVGAEEIVVVVGHQREAVKGRFAGQSLIFVEQKEQLGTGHAVLQASHQFNGYEGTVLIMCGDVPLVRPGTIKELLAFHKKERALVTILTAHLPDPTGYGRIIKNQKGEVIKIVEESDADTKEKAICEINTGIYCIESPFLFAALQEVGRANAQGEYYLTDVVTIALKRGEIVRNFAVRDFREVVGINTPEELLKAHRYLEELTGISDHEDRLSFPQK